MNPFKGPGKEEGKPTRQRRNPNPSLGYTHFPGTGNGQSSSINPTSSNIHMNTLYPARNSSLLGQQEQNLHTSCNYSRFLYPPVQPVAPGNSRPLNRNSSSDIPLENSPSTSFTIPSSNILLDSLRSNFRDASLPRSTSESGRPQQSSNNRFPCPCPLGLLCHHNQRASSYPNGTLPPSLFNTPINNSSNFNGSNVEINRVPPSSNQSLRVNQPGPQPATQQASQSRGHFQIERGNQNQPSSGGTLSGNRGGQQFPTIHIGTSGRTDPSNPRVFSPEEQRIIQMAVFDYDSRPGMNLPQPTQSRGGDASQSLEQQEMQERIEIRFQQRFKKDDLERLQGQDFRVTVRTSSVKDVDNGLTDNLRDILQTGLVHYLDQSGHTILAQQQVSERSETRLDNDSATIPPTCGFCGQHQLIPPTGKDCGSKTKRHHPFSRHSRCRHETEQIEVIEPLVQQSLAKRMKNESQAQESRIESSERRSSVKSPTLGGESSNENKTINGVAVPEWFLRLEPFMREIGLGLGGKRNERQSSESNEESGHSMKPERNQDSAGFTSTSSTNSSVTPDANNNIGPRFSTAAFEEMLMLDDDDDVITASGAESEEVELDELVKDLQK